MIDEQINGILKIAEKHVTVLQDTLTDMAKNYPFSADFVTNLNNADLRTLDTMTGRFGKLQDLMGTKIIDIYLQTQGQPIEGISMLDKIHKLEKLRILENDDLWDRLRKARNHIAHEYPDRPDLAAQHLNSVYELSPLLIGIFQKLAREISKG